MIRTACGAICLALLVSGCATGIGSKKCSEFEEAECASNPSCAPETRKECEDDANPATCRDSFHYCRDKI